MKLITKEIEGQFAKVGEQDIPDPLVILRLFDPYGSYTGYFTSYNKAARVLFGYVTGLQENELGYSSLDEIEALRFLGSPRIERDINFTPCKLSECHKTYGFD